MSLVPSDLQGTGLWDPRLNHIAVLRVLSTVEPATYGIDPSNWRQLVIGACRQWEESGVVAFTQNFVTPMDTPDAVEGAVVIKVHDSPDDSWKGFTNAYTEWKNGLVQSALVWVDPDAFTGSNKIEYLKFVIAHELGHVLGLAHRPDSIMAAPGMSGSSFSVLPADLDRLRELYA